MAPETAGASAAIATAAKEDRVKASAAIFILFMDTSPE
jgi:hypothetical protein